MQFRPAGGFDGITRAVAVIVTVAVSVATLPATRAARRVAMADAEAEPKSEDALPPEETAAGQESPPESGDPGSGSSGSDSAGSKKRPAVRAYYDKGVHIESADGNYKARIRWRAQMRLTDLGSPDLVGEEDGVEEESGFAVRRARFKLDGHAYRPWLGYYLEYGIVAAVMLTLQLDVDRYEKANVRVGQYKVIYNRERVDSSGSLQFADRSIVNAPFTVDRQSGITVKGRLMPATRGDSRYAAGVFTGTGRGGDLDVDRHPMYVGRWQWNFMGRDLPFSESDIERHPKTTASLAAAASSNRSPFTSFSSSGGGQLPGFPDATEPGQYEIRQWMTEFALMRRGLSVQSEYHEKRIDDRLTGTRTDLEGFYGQVGYFFSEAFDRYPKPLELAVRAARVDTDRGVEIPADRELTLAANWFFAGHDNKLTADVSRLKSTLAGGSSDRGWRARFQWDISF